MIHSRINVYRLGQRRPRTSPGDRPPPTSRESQAGLPPRFLNFLHRSAPFAARLYAAQARFSPANPAKPVPTGTTEALTDGLTLNLIILCSSRPGSMSGKWHPTSGSRAGSSGGVALKLTVLHSCVMPIVILHGSSEQIASGHGEVVVTAAQAAARLGVSASRIRQLVSAGQIAPIGERFHGADLFREVEVEVVKAERAAAYRRDAP